ncbi:MAG: amidohydrolase [Sporolactobacillus sp.]|jgi:aminobenzoyl-glutamate utilization protein B|nr:amidohydrolase [Sporolactobacillus sp.]
MKLTTEIEESIDSDYQLFSELSQQIWDLAELSYQEFKSAKILSKALEKEGFSVAENVAGLKTGFIGSYGSGKPVIAILGELDALPGLSQKAGVAAPNPVVAGGNGHGCGHNLLGVGSLAAAFAVKRYLSRHHMLGTVRYYGCPAEESGSGKVFMIKAGCFNDVDAAFSWHPGTVNEVMHLSSTASLLADFQFKGKSSHASASPERGRSALDAMELMHVGCNYLREHIPNRARIHYAVKDGGGISPNVVQSYAEERCMVRAETVEEVKQIFQRVIKIAEGASLMTETKMSYRIQGGTYNLIPNTTLHRAMAHYMNELNYPEYTDEDVRLIRSIFQSFDSFEQKSIIASIDSHQIKQAREVPIACWIDPFSEKENFMQPSTDAADVSWNVPTGRCKIATWALGTPVHSWQAVAQGKTHYAINAALFAGKALACTAVQAMIDRDFLTTAQNEWKERLNGSSYQSLIPDDVQPPTD